MTYQEIIQTYKDVILDLYVNQNYKKSAIAYKLINDLNLDFTNAQVDSFRRSLNQYLQDWDQAHLEHIDEPDESTAAPVDKFPNARRTRARVLLLDVETTPIIAAVWKLRKEYINIDQVLTESHLLSWAGKWLFEPDVFGDVLTPEEALADDDSRIIKNLWAVMDEADIIIAHNGRRFDIPVINGRFLVNGLTPPSPYEVIDTLDTAQRTFRLSSNKLDFINRLLGLTTKIETKFKLWLDCRKGVPTALLEMFTYNKNDVSILEESYMAIRPWIKAHPNMGFYVESDEPICPTCGCTHVEECGTYSTTINQYVAYRCPECGAIGRSRKASTSVEKKQTLIYSLGR